MRWKRYLSSQKTTLVVFFRYHIRWLLANSFHVLINQLYFLENINCDVNQFYLSGLTMIVKKKQPTPGQPTLMFVLTGYDWEIAVYDFSFLSVFFFFFFSYRNLLPINTIVTIDLSISCCTARRGYSFKYRDRVFYNQYRLNHDCVLSVPCMLRRMKLTSYFTAFNTLRLRQDDRHFADDILKCIFLNKNAWISLLKFRINNIPALVQIMAWCRQGDKPLSASVMVSLVTYICVTRPQWVNVSKSS